jgi:RecA-family ATPase
MNKQPFVPIRAGELRDLADERNEQGEYLFPDLGPATSIEQLLFRPERPYLVEGVLTQGSLALLSAESFVGKTFFGMELARAVSTGTPFMGKYPVSRGGVLYIAQDGSDEEYIRQWKKLVKGHWDEYRALPGWQTWRAALTGEYVPSGQHPDPPALHLFNGRIRFEFNRALGIDIAEDVTRIGLTALRAEHSRGDAWRLDESGGRSLDPDATEKGVKLIVFDAGHSVFFGNENDSGEVQNVMTNLRQLANATGATVFLIVHLNKYSPTTKLPKIGEHRVRGSGVFQSAPDWHMQLHRGKADGEIYAFQLKDRAGNRCKSFIFSMTFDEQKQQMTLAHLRDMSTEEHRDRKVRPIALMPDLPDPKVAVVAEFDKGHEMSRYDVAAALRLLPQFKDKADSTVEDAAKEMISRLEDDGVIRQTQKPAKGRKALYRKADVGQESA